MLTILPKLQLDYVEFYITNFCNFNCNGCNRFNNYAFNGRQEWLEYADLYRRWSEILNFKEFTILGGEPMTNPDYLEWLQGIIQLWPDARGSFLTNGYYLKSDNKSLYNLLNSTQGKVTLNIGLHNLNRKDTVLATVNDWLEGEVTITRYPDNLRQLYNFDRNWVASYSAIRDDLWPDCPTVDEWDLLSDNIKSECEMVHNFSPSLLAENLLGYRLTDTNGVTVLIQNENYFHQGALKPLAQSFKLHNSDPIQAHNICHSKFCHHFDKGLLYKCGQVSVIQEFDQQFYLELTPEDRELMQSYQPANIDNTYEELLQFIKNLDQPMPQCKFCPENYDIREISAEHGKKIKFQRKKNV